MPAVTVDNVLALPRIDRPAAPATEPPVVSVTSAPSGFEGEGFPVRRAFAGVDLALLDPFIHMDQMGEVEYGPGEPRGTSWHPPPRLRDGHLHHRRNLRAPGQRRRQQGVVTNGDTQWMTAQLGIQHIERPPESLVQSGGTFHGLQLWVNLPKTKKWEAPRYQDIRAGRATLLTTADGGALVRVIAGDIAGHAGPGVTRTPMAFVHATLSPGAELVLPWQPDFNALVYALNGEGTVGSGSGGSGRRPFRMGQLAVFGKGDFVTVTASERQESRSPNLDVIVLGGRPIREPIAWYGPFVMNTREEVIPAMDDFHAGRLGTIPASSLKA